MVDDAVAFVAVLLWAMTAGETIAVLRRRHPEPTLNALGTTFAFLAVSATFFIPTVHLATGRLTGIGNFAEPLARTALMGAAWSVQLLLHHLANDGSPTHHRHRAVVLVGFVTALWVSFALAPVDRTTVMFTRDYGHEAIVAVYLLMCLTYLGLALIEVIRGTRRYRRTAGRPLATALHLIGAGCWLGLGYITVKVTFIALLAAGRGASGSAVESAVGRLLAVGGALLIIIGAILPFLATRTTHVRAWAAAYRDLRRLYPLWSLMHRATPAIALDPPRSRLADIQRVTDLELRRYRRVVEIHDGRLALTPYLPATTALGARDDIDHNAEREAAAIVRAVHRKLSGWPADCTRPPPDDGPATLDDEIAWLTRVAAHLRHGGLSLTRPVGQNPATSPTTRTHS